MFFLILLFFSIIILTKQDACDVPCKGCPSEFYFNKGFQISEYINFGSDCSLKSQSDENYEQIFFLRNFSCSNEFSPSDCSGTLENPFDDFWKIMRKIHEDDSAQKFLQQKIKIYFIGTPHYFKYNASIFYSPKTMIRLFKDFNASIEMGSLNNDLIDVFVKTDLFQIFVSHDFHFFNLRIFGNDIVLSEDIQKTCLQESIICCDTNGILKYTECNVISGIEISFTDEKLEFNSLFLFGSLNTDLIPKLNLSNIHFLNINSMKNSSGWRALILASSSNFELTMSNITISDSFFSHGFMNSAYDLRSFAINLTRNIVINNLVSQKLNPFSIKDLNSSILKNGLFIFGNEVMISIRNLTIQLILFPQSVKIYFLVILGSSKKSNININGIQFVNVTCLAFIKTNFSILNLSNLLFSNFSDFNLPFIFINNCLLNINFGSFVNVYSLNTFPIFSFNNESLIYLSSLTIQNTVGYFGNFSNAIVSLSNITFDKLIKSDYLIRIYASNLTLLNANFSNSIFNKEIFLFILLIKLDVNKLVINNVNSPNFFWVESSHYLNYQTKLVFYDLTMINTPKYSILIGSTFEFIHEILLRNMTVDNCVNLGIINLQINFMKIELINILIKNTILSLISFSYFIVTLYERSLTFINFEYFPNFTIKEFRVQDCYGTANIISFKNEKITTTFNVINFSLTNFLLSKTFILDSSAKSFKINMENITIYKIKSTILGFSHFYFLVFSSIESISINNISFDSLFSFEFINLPSKFSQIIITNCSITNIKTQFGSLFKIFHIYEENEIKVLPSTFIIKNFIFQNFKILATSTPLFFNLTSYNIPINFEFTNFFVQNLNFQFTLVFATPSKLKLFSINATNIELLNIKLTKYLFVFVISPINELFLKNIHLNNCESITVVNLPQMFTKVIMSNIVIVGIYHSDFYVIKISQQLTKSNEYNFIQLNNVTLIDVDINSDFTSPYRSIYLGGFDELNINTLIIRNFGSANLSLSGLISCIEITDVKKATLSNIDFVQNISSVVQQFLKISNIFYNLIISSSKFEIVKNIGLRTFQCLVILNCYNVEFHDNQIYGMSTIERPQFTYEQTGVVSFMAENSYSIPSSGEYFLYMQNNTFQNNVGIKYGITSIIGFTKSFLYNNSWIDNHAEHGGGLTIMLVNFVVIDKISFFDCFAFSEGGGMYLSKIDFINLQNMVFHNLSSYSEAGCFYLQLIKEANFMNASISKSWAQNAGGVGYLLQIQNILFTNFFIHNSSSSSGGMFFFNEKINVIMKDCIFSFGESSDFGGFAYISGNYINIFIHHSDFFTFFSAKDGAIIYSFNIENLTFSNVNFFSSKCENKCLGIIYLEGYSDMINNEFNFYDIVFIDNAAEFGVNFYYSSNNKFTVSNITSKNNIGSPLRFESDKIGMVLIESYTLVLNNYHSHEFVTNSLIFFSQCNAIIRNSIFSNNYGKAHLFEIILGSALKIENSNITDYFALVSDANYSDSFILSNIANFYVISSTIISKNNSIGFSFFYNDNQISCFEIKESVLSSDYDSFFNFLLRNQLFFIAEKCVINFNFIDLRNNYFEKDIFWAKLSNLSVNNSAFKYNYFKENKKNCIFKMDGFGLTKLYELRMENCYFESFFGGLISTTNVFNISLVNTFFKSIIEDSSNNVLSVLNSQHLSINQCHFENFQNDIGSCLYLISTLDVKTKISINNSKFYNNKALTAPIYLRGNISLLIKECEFKGNKAIYNQNIVNKNAGKGGCIVLDCENYLECQSTISKSIFLDNEAESLGPTILSKSPVKIEVLDSIFLNNKDGLNFTKNYSTLPIALFYKLKSANNSILIQSNVNVTIISGRSFSFSIELFDSNHNILLTENKAQGEIICSYTNYEKLFLDKAVARSIQGILKFEDVLIIYKPDSTLQCELTISYSNDLIFETFVEKSDKKLESSFLKKSINFNIRKCIAGEIHQPDDSCYECPAGKYSLDDPNDNSKKFLKCWECPLNAICLGGNKITPLEGFWRAINYSILIVPCPSKYGCLGMNDNDFYELTEEEQIRGVCANENEGNLCFSCKKGYARSKNEGECQECQSLYAIYIKMALTLVFFVVYIFFQVNIFSKGKQEDPHLTVLMKLLLNHFQIFSITKLLYNDLKVDFTLSMDIENYFSFVYQDFMFIDCLIQDINEDMYIQKVIFTTILPILFFLIMTIFWLLAFLFLFIKKKILANNNLSKFLQNKLTATLIILVFILYAEILKKGFSLFNCILINEETNQSVLKMSPNLDCWDYIHTFWILVVALPAVLFWGILAPAFTMLVLFKHKNHLYVLVYEIEIKTTRKMKKMTNQPKTLKRKIKIDLEQKLAEKLFEFGNLPPSNNIGYNLVSKKCKVIQSVEFCIKEKEKILNDIDQIKYGKGKKEEYTNLFFNTQFLVKNPQEIYEYFEIGFQPFTKITDKDLNEYLFNVHISQKEISKFKKNSKIQPNIIPKLQNTIIDEKTQILIKNLSFVFPGYRKECFYWEALILMRKFVLTLISTYDQLFPSHIKPALILNVILILIFLQINFHPYLIKYMNILEVLSLITSFLSVSVLMCSMSDSIKQLELFLLLAFLINNSIFFIYLVYYGFKYAEIYIKMKMFFRNLIKDIKTIKSQTILKLRLLRTAHNTKRNSKKI